MTVCKFFLKGNCRYGNRCRFQHETPNSHQESRGRNERGRYNDRYENYDDSSDRNYSNFIKSAHFEHNKSNRGSQGDYSSPFSRNNQQPVSSFSSNQQTKFHSTNSSSNQRPNQDKFHWKRSTNQFDALQDQGDGNSFNDVLSEDQTLIDMIQKDMTSWHGTMWPYSCYSCEKSKHCLEGLADIQAEELRTLFYLHGEDAYKMFMLEVDNMYARRKQELIDMSDQTRMSVLTNLHGNTEVNPSSNLKILSLYGPDTSFKTGSSSSANIPTTFSSTSLANPSSSATAISSPSITMQSLFKAVTSPQTITSSSAATNPVYTDKSILTDPELEQFQAKSFTLGKIPMRPPSEDLCR